MLNIKHFRTAFGRACALCATCVLHRVSMGTALAEQRRHRPIYAQSSRALSFAALRTLRAKLTKMADYFVVKRECRAEMREFVHFAAQTS